MAGKQVDYEIKRLPLTRRAIVDVGHLGRNRNAIHGLFEADVTEARRILASYKEKSGEGISFTAFILHCLGLAVDGNRYFHARRDLWGRLVLFDRVDCTVLVEVELQGRSFPLAHIVRGINRRSVRSIHEEIRSVQRNPEPGRSSGLPGWGLYAFLLLPGFLRRLAYRILARLPGPARRQVGTIMVSSVGMFGAGSGWGISPGSIYTTDLLLGGMVAKPVIMAEQVVVREFLSITVNFDHDIIDGAPAARFVSAFKDLIEQGRGLADFA